jgi:hypothetical protein
MIRYAAFLTIIVAGAATAVAAISPAPSAASRNITVIEKNQAFPVYGPIVVEPCAKEDCSDAA